LTTPSKSKSNMTKKHFIGLANAIRDHNAYESCGGIEGMHEKFTTKQIETLANYCATTNCFFKRQLWLDYIAGLCGPNGGAIKVKQEVSS